MRAFLLILFLATCSAQKGEYRTFLDKAGKDAYFKRDKSLERFKEFKQGALNMTKKNFRDDNDDVKRENIKLGFEVFRNFSKKATKQLLPGKGPGVSGAGDEAVDTLGLMLNKDVLDDARGKLADSKRKEFDKEISLEGQKARMQIAKNLIDGGDANSKREYNTDNMKLFIHRAPKADLVNKYLRVDTGDIGAFKLPKNLTLPANATAVVHQLRKDDGHWGRNANKYKVKSHVIGMQVLKDDGTAVDIKNLADANRISIRFPGFGGAGDCAWWDIENGEWSEEGCERTPSPADAETMGAECLCNHLTEFAIVESVTANATTTTTTTTTAAAEEGWTAGDTTTVVIGSLIVSGGLFAAFVRSPFDSKNDAPMSRLP